MSMTADGTPEKTPAKVTVGPHNVVTALLENESGTINRVVSLFRRRGFSLGSFTAGDCERPGFSRMTCVVDGDPAVVQQVLRQLDKLLDVVEVETLPLEEGLIRELALVAVDGGEASYEVAAKYGARHTRLADGGAAIQFAGRQRELEAFLAELEPHGVREVVRSGAVALRTGAAPAWN